MADQTHIEWTDATWNIITGCTMVDEGCRNCYAARLAVTRLQHHPSRAGLARVNANGEAKFTGEVRFNEQWLDQPLRWSKPRRIFVCAHGDLFHESVPDEWIDRVFAVMALAQQHTFQVLTKRPERAIEYLAKHDTSTRGDTITDSAFLMNRAVRGYAGSGGSASWPLLNVGLGTSISDQASADLRIPPLLACPTVVRFVVAEPLLGLVRLDQINPSTSKWHNHLDALAGGRLSTGGRTGIDWVIVGGESGPRARSMHPDWARTLRDQCIAAGVPFFFKQWGGVNKKKTGRVLSGRTWDELPQAI